MEQKRFLTHVNALRGLAILLVFLYHLREPWCPYGFLGVDAFFVISGFFLIPPLLNQSRDSAGFNWWRYYKGKITRIVPPLAVIVLLTMLLAVPFFAPGDLKEAAKAAQSTLTGVANVHLGKQAVDYFATSVKENLFLHAWYIAVLLQMLLVAPLLCVPLSRLRAVWRYIILGVLAVFSALIYFQHWMPETWQQALPSFLLDGGTLGSVYYQTAGRIWQVLAGGFVALLPISGSKLMRTGLLTVGLLLIAVPSFWNANYGGFALLAVIGAMLTIRYGEDTLITKLFENRIIMWLGTISFSLYLIHWPLFAIGRYALIRDFSLMECAGVASLSLLLAWISYLFLEKRRVKLTTAIILWALAFSSVWTIRRTHGLDGYVHHLQEIRTLDDARHQYNPGQLAPSDPWYESYSDVLTPADFFYGAQVQDKSSPDYGKKPILQIGSPSLDCNFVLIGDSYAEALVLGMDTVGKEDHWSGLYLNTYVTPFWNRFNKENRSPQLACNRVKAEALMQWLASKPQLRYVIIHQLWNNRFLPSVDWDGNAIPKEKAWEYSANALKEYCAKIKAMGKEVILLTPMPYIAEANTNQLKNIIQRAGMWYQSEEHIGNILCSRQKYDATMGSICALMRELEAEGYCTVIDLTKDIFEDGLFDPRHGSHLLIYDFGHLTDYGSLFVVRSLREQFGAFLTQKASGETAQESPREEEIPNASDSVGDEVPES